MSDRSSRPKDKSVGKRPPEAESNLEATVILNTAAKGLVPDQRVRIPRSQLVEPGGETVQIARQPEPEAAGPSEGTMIMPMAAPPEPATLPGIEPTALAEPGERTQIIPRVPPIEESTVRILPHERDRILAGEGTMILPAAALAPDELDIRPDLVMPPPEVGAPMEGTMILPVAALAPPEESTVRILPEDRDRILAGEGTMIMPVAALAPPEESTVRILPEDRDRILAGEGSMIMPATALSPIAQVPARDEDALAGLLPLEAEAPMEGTVILPMDALTPVPVEDTPTKPDLQVPPEIRAAGEGTVILHSAEPAAMPTAAEVIKERLAASDARLAGYPRATPEPAIPMHATPRSVPTLPAELMPPPPEPELLADPAPDETDPESPRSTLRVPIKEMPELRQQVPVAARLPFEARTEPARFVDEESLPPSVVEPYRPAPAPATAATAPVPAAAGGEGFSPEGQLGTPPGRSFALLWMGVIAVVVVLIGGLWAVNMGWIGGGTPSAKPVAAPAPAEGARLPESMRPAFEKALAGDPNAMRYLGVCYVNGLGVPVDRSEGLKWYRRAAAAGSSAAQQDLLALEAQGVR